MILVTGATGRLGAAVVRTLRQVGQPVRALVRRGSAYFWLNDSGCAYFFGDLRDPSSLNRACKGITHLVACSGINLESRDNNHTSVTVEGHQALWDAARAQGVGRVIYVSAVGVERGYPVPWFDARRQAEETLMASGLEWVILRPSVFTRTFVEIARWKRQGNFLLIPGSGNNPVSPISLSDVALYVMACLELPWAVGRTIELFGPETLSAREVLDIATDVSGLDLKILPVPERVVSVLAQASRPVGLRWKHRLEHLKQWFSDDFSGSSHGLVQATNIPMRGVREAIEADVDALRPLEDPQARENQVVHRRFEATVYRPGEVALDSLPDGPLRYD